MQVDERALSFGKLNLIALGLTALVVPGVALLYATVWGGFHLQVSGRDVLMFGLAVIPLIFLHELLHAIGFIYFGKVDRSYVKMGIHWKSLTPYATCTVPVSIGAYRWTGALPILVLGLIPTAIGIGFGLGLLTTYGTFMILGGLGDVTILWLIRRDKDVYVLDLTDRIGCLILPRGEPARESDQALS